VKRREALPSLESINSSGDDLPAASFQNSVSAEPDLNGRRMRVMSTDTNGVVSSDTILVFEQTGNVVSARYRGGSIIDGYLIGVRESTSLRFRYVQVDERGNLDAGVSTGTIELLPDGRLRLIEQFQWLTRPEAGTNIFEEILS